MLMANTRLSKLTPLEIPLSVFDFFFFFFLCSISPLAVCCHFVSLDLVVAFNETVIMVNTCAYKVSHIAKHMFEIPMRNTI